MTTKERLVVIGNGMAGVATIEHLLTKRADTDITVFGRESHVNYNRVLLSSVLAGEMQSEEIILNPHEWYEKNGIALHIGKSVSHVNIKDKCVITESGEAFSFDKLLIATGSVPFIPPIKGIYNNDSQKSMKIPPPLNPLPQGEGKAGEINIPHLPREAMGTWSENRIPPPLTGGGGGGG